MNVEFLPAHEDEFARAALYQDRCLEGKVTTIISVAKAFFLDGRAGVADQTTSGCGISA